MAASASASRSRLVLLAVGVGDAHAGPGANDVALDRNGRPGRARTRSVSWRISCSGSAGPTPQNHELVASSRATVSLERTSPRSRLATSISSRSPASCPSVSFTDLKSSRSANRTPTLPPARLRERLLELLLEQGPIRQACQRVVQGQVPEFRLLGHQLAGQTHALVVEAAAHGYQAPSVHRSIIDSAFPARRGSSQPLGLTPDQLARRRPGRPGMP